MSLFLNLQRMTLLLAAALVITGCATSQSMSDEDRRAIQTVQIDQTVEKGDLFLLAPGGASAGLLFGAVGAMASSGATADSQTAFVEYLKKNEIAMERIFQEAFENDLRASGKFSVANDVDSKRPTIKLSIPQYGFSVPHLLSSNVVAVLQVKAEMVDGAGKVIWSATERILPSIMSPMESKPWSELVADPKQVEDQLRKAAAHLSQKLVASL